MTWFLLGAGWVLASLGLGAFGAWLWIRFKPKEVPKTDSEDVQTLIHRLGTVESKINLLTAFRKGEGK